ncbi:S-layer homology domain-containing protein [Patescibacteria group bacterium]|nr:S-layer homology domain-containing protein [Patescibacteria group bacterium]
MKKILSFTFAILCISMLAGVTHATGYCGDGILDESAGEQCDDENFTNRDGCSSYCILEDMTPPEVTSVSIGEGATNIATTTNKITVTFSEPVDPSSINSNTVKLKQYSTKLDTDYDLSDDGKTVTLNINEDLYGDLDHTVVVELVKDIAGNLMTGIYIRTFTTGAYIDHTPPNIKARPEGGNHHIAQSVTLTPYIGTLTTSDEFIDEEATIYYTLTGAIPTTKSDIYNGKSFSISKNTTLRYFGVDEAGNTSEITTQTYIFSCDERLNAKEVTSYPTCSIQECDHGYKLQNNVCVIDYNFDENDYRVNAATAPLLGSNTPMTISTKPALYITPEHRGIIPRPILFKELTSGTTITFERDTEIFHTDGRAFAGYIRPPEMLFSKDYPINFGYTFKSIFNFEPIDGEDLTFDPPYKLTIPFTDRYDPEASVTVFIYNPDTEEYFKHNPNWVFLEADLNQVTIMADRPGAFFVAQPGKNYNKVEFQDTIDHWSKNYAEELYRMGIVKGRDKGVFAPDDILTRAEFTKIALNAIGEEVDPLENVESSPFMDVALYAWYVPYVKRAKEIGLINGYPNGEFQPDNPVNKAEAIAILMRAFDFNTHSAGARGDNYSDILTDQWYFPAVNFAIHNRLTDGIRLPNGTIMNTSFGPARNITRGEMAKLAIKTIELNEEVNGD